MEKDHSTDVRSLQTGSSPVNSEAETQPSNREKDDLLAVEFKPLCMLRGLDPTAAAQQVIELCIQEYTALRAEQRTRLDSANKIINYYALVVAAVIGGLLTLFTKVDDQTFMSIFQTVMLLVPIVTLPFAFTQQNEEIFVRHIGEYCDTIKSQISSKADESYWYWEDYHNKPSLRPPMLRFTGFFRSGLLIIFSFLSLLILLFLYSTSGGLVSPLEWLRDVKLRSREFVLGLLWALDWILITWAIVIGVKMSRQSGKKLDPSR